MLFVLWLVVQTPDSATRVRWEAALRASNDSLDRVRWAISTFRADLDQTSSVLVLQRASGVRTGCAGARHALADLHALLGGAYSSKLAKEQAELRTSTGRLLGVMDRCESEWSPTPPTAPRADSLKAWGPYRTAQLGNALDQFIGTLRRFMKAAGMITTA